MLLISVLQVLVVATLAIVAVKEKSSIQASLLSKFLDKNFEKLALTFEQMPDTIAKYHEMLDEIDKLDNRDVVQDNIEKFLQEHSLVMSFLDHYDLEFHEYKEELKDYLKELGSILHKDAGSGIDLVMKKLSQATGENHELDKNKKQKIVHWVVTANPENIVKFALAALSIVDLVSSFFALQARIGLSNAKMENLNGDIFPKIDLSKVLKRRAASANYYA